MFQHRVLLFGSVLWALWKYHISHVFGSNTSDGSVLWDECTRLYDQCLLSRMNLQHLSHNTRANTGQVQRWQIPWSGWKKLNTAGFWWIGSRLASCGVILCSGSDSDARICGFSRFVGRCCVLEV
ncbi:hypothetical protein GQ457_12G001790 [Hibiscus cannabinus]